MLNLEINKEFVKKKSVFYEKLLGKVNCCQEQQRLALLGTESMPGTTLWVGALFGLGL